MSIQLLPNELSGAKIKVVGIGGGGGNIVNSMVDKGIDGVEFIAVNTDLQALEASKADVIIQIGKNVTKGLGTGMKNDIGEKAAEENREEISRELTGSDMSFITAGMGGGTGTGAAPIIAKLARSLDILTVGVVTTPFDFEGKPRMHLAEIGIEKLKKEVDSMIIIPNQRILELIPKDCTKAQAFSMANKVLYNAVKGISQIITKTGEINVDFNDIKTTMKSTGDAMIGIGIATGEERALKAVGDALFNPLLENVDIHGAKNVLVNISSGGDIKMSEIELINKTICDAAGDKATFIFGLLDDNDLEEGQVMVTMIATGFRNAVEEEITDAPEETYSKAANSDVDLNVGKITELPKDTKDLQKLDEPAWKRRNSKMVSDDLSEPAPQKSSIASKYGLDDLNIKDAQPPSFLRRSLD